MTPSKYQTAIFEAVESTTDNLMVNAKAGSGKTTTIKQVARRLPESLSILFVAFNKHIADALKRDLPSNVQAMTMNSFGWRICAEQVRGLNRRVEPNKTENVYKTFFDMDDKNDRTDYYKTKGVATRLVSLFKAEYWTKDITAEKIQEVADFRGIDLPKQPWFNGFVQGLYEKCLNYSSFMDFDDQIFMPLYLGLKVPMYDVVIIDELQDLNRVQQLLVAKAGNRIIGVGDPEQSIYSFRGADPDAMPNFKVQTGARELPLSICYRCPKKVVAAAQKIVPEIEWSPDAPDGVVADKKQEDFEREATDGDYVLCRTTAPLVSGCLAFIRRGKKATVRGRDIGQQLVILIDKLARNDQEDCESFRYKLNEYRMEQLARLQALEREAQIVALEDRVDTIEILMEGANDVAGIKQKIDQIFADEKVDYATGKVTKIPGIVFCTVHRSKGLEAPRIWILRPELLPHPSAKNAEQVKQEKNLEYVAITRSMAELYFIR